MPKTQWLVQEFNNTEGIGSNSFFSSGEVGKVRQVIFRNQGSAIANISVGTVGGGSITIMPRESFSFQCYGDDSDTTTYYVRWQGAGTQNVVALIQKTVE